MKTMRLNRLFAKAVIALMLLSGGGIVYVASAATTATTLSLTISGSLNVSIVDAGGSVVDSPAVTMSAADWSNTAVVTSTGTLGEATQKIRVTNPTATEAWSLTLAATSGATTTWSDGASSFDFNDGASGADNNGVTDTDLVGGQLTVDPSGGTMTGTGDPASATTNISLGSSTAFAEVSADSVTLVTASATAEAPGQWDITGISLSQKIPARTPAGVYILGLTLTLT